MAFEHSATVFHVSDLDASLKFYTEVLGFEQDFRFGQYAGIKCGPVSLHLAQGGDDQHPIGSGNIYIFCEDVDGYYAEITKKGAKVKTEPRDWPYGMRDFIAIDPNSNHLAFGCETKKSSS